MPGGSYSSCFLPEIRDRSELLAAQEENPSRGVSVSWAFRFTLLTKDSVCVPDALNKGKFVEVSKTKPTYFLSNSALILRSDLVDLCCIIKRNKFRGLFVAFPPVIVAF